MAKNDDPDFLAKLIEDATTDKLRKINGAKAKKDWLLTSDEAKGRILVPLCRLKRLSEDNYNELMERIGSEFGDDKTAVLRILVLKVNQLAEENDTTGPNEWKKQLHKAGGKWAKVPLNARIILENDPEVKGTLRFNVFKHQIEVVKTPVWDRREFVGVRLFDDIDTNLLQDWFQRKYKLPLGPSQINSAVVNVALGTKIDPPTDYLKECHQKWIEADRPRLLETVDRECFKHTIKQLSGERNMVVDIFIKFMIGLVVRILRPGCKNDMMLILVGNEGILKSTFFETLVGVDWFTDCMPSISGNRDNCTRHMQGKLICEWAEIKTLMRSREEEYKEFLSCKVDTFTQKWEKWPRDYQRRWIIVGTVNKDKAQELKGAENRRMTFIEFEGSEPIDVKWVLDHRDLLFGEAVERYENGETWHFDDDDMIQQQRETNADYVKFPRGYDVVSDYLSNRTKVTAAEIAKLLSTSISLDEYGRMNVNSREPTKADEMDASATAILLGWKRKRIWVGKRFLQHYLSPDYVKQDDVKQDDVKQDDVKQDDVKQDDVATGAATPEEFTVDQAKQWNEPTKKFLWDKFAAENKPLIDKLKDQT